MEIRICKNTDIKEIYHLICELEDTEFNYEIFREVCKYKINDNRCYSILGIANHKIIAFLCMKLDYQLHHTSKVATIEELIVSTLHRSNGIGKTLLDHAISYAKKSDCEVIELTSNFSRERAHNFYMKNGFKKGSFKFKLELK